MLKRLKDGKLLFESLDFKILISDMFELCVSEKEKEWLKDIIISEIEVISEE